jgi:hypothetical protein
MAGILSAAPTPQYSFVFDKAKDSWVCSVHGEGECRHVYNSHRNGDGLFQMTANMRARAEERERLEKATPGPSPANAKEQG